MAQCSPEAPQVITFEDEPPTQHISKTTDNFYPDPPVPAPTNPMNNSSSFYEPSVQSAHSSGVRHTYSRPPSCKKSASSKRSSSKEGSLLDEVKAGAGRPRLTLNELAIIKKNGTAASRGSGAPNQDTASKKSNSKKKESCLMQYFHSESGSQDGGSQASSRRSSGSKAKPAKKDSLLMTNLNPQKSAKQLPQQKPLQKQQSQEPSVLKRNLYHIDSSGNLVKDYMFFQSGGSQ